MKSGNAYSEYEIDDAGTRESEIREKKLGLSGSV